MTARDKLPSQTLHDIYDMTVVGVSQPVDAPVHIHIDDEEAATSVPPSVFTHRISVVRVDTPASLASILSSRDSKSSVISSQMAPLHEELDIPNDLEAPVLPSFEGAGLSEVSLAWSLEQAYYYYTCWQHTA